MPIDLAATILMLGLSGIGLATALIYRPPGFRPWAAVNALVMAVALVTLQLGLPWSALATGLLFFPLVLLPQVLSRFAQRSVLRGEFGRAAAAVRALVFVNPWSASTVTGLIYSALAEPRVAASIAALERARLQVAPDYRAYIDAQIAAARGAWAEVRQIASDARAEGMTAMKLRAEGELGDIGAMLNTLVAAESSLQPPDRDFARLFAFALAGRPYPVSVLLNGRLAMIPTESKAYWTAVARLRRDPADASARAALTELAAGGLREQTRIASARHLADIDSARPSLTDGASGALLDRIARDIEAPEPVRPGVLQSPVTLLLLLANLLVFASDFFFDTSSGVSAIVRDGALWEPAITEGGEWWRLATAAFIHLGIFHLAFNLVALDALGRSIEASLGHLGMLATYLGLAVTSNTVVYLLIRFDVLDPHFLVGASGAIMGMLGVILAWAGLRWLRTRRVDDSRRLLLLVFIVGLQALIDASVPQISAAAHLSGLAAGVALGLVLMALRVPRETPE